MNKTLVAVLAASLLAGCSTSSQVFQSKKIDYTTVPTTAPTLDVPPDLTPIQTDDRYGIPGQDKATTLTQFNQEKQEKPNNGIPATDHSGVLPAFGNLVKIESDGTQRWLVVKSSPDKVWAGLESFWASNGFKLQSDDPKIGIMETQWKDNKTAAPQNFIKHLVGSVMDSLVSSPVRDQFRVRIERGAEPGTTEIYLFHKGMEEMLNKNNYTGSIWQPLPNNPEIETEYLKKLAVKFGESPEEADTVLAKEDTPQKPDEAAGNTNASHISSSAKLVPQADGGTLLTINEPFDRAWRKIGLALDRSAFTVEDRDRAAGVYFIRYTTDEESGKKNGSKGFFSKLAFWRSEDKTKDTQTYRLSVSSVSGHGTTVDLRDKTEAKVPPATSQRILTLIYDQLH